MGALSHRPRDSATVKETKSRWITLDIEIGEIRGRASGRVRRQRSCAVLLSASRTAGPGPALADCPRVMARRSCSFVQISPRACRSRRVPNSSRATRRVPNSPRADIGPKGICCVAPRGSRHAVLDSDARRRPRSSPTEARCFRLHPCAGNCAETRDRRASIVPGLRRAQVLRLGAGNLFPGGRGRPGDRVAAVAVRPETQRAAASWPRPSGCARPHGAMRDRAAVARRDCQSSSPRRAGTRAVAVRDLPAETALRRSAQSRRAARWRGRSVPRDDAAERARILDAWPADRVSPRVTDF